MKDSKNYISNVKKCKHNIYTMSQYTCYLNEILSKNPLFTEEVKEKPKKKKPKKKIFPKKKIHSLFMSNYTEILINMNKFSPNTYTFLYQSNNRHAYIHFVIRKCKLF